jgi:hypothetical protein
MNHYNKFRNSWAILPAAQCLFGKSKVTIDEIVKECGAYSGQGTVVVCMKPNGQFHFISGASGNYAKIGQVQDVHHDQSLARIGTWTVVNEISYSAVEGVTCFTYAVPPVMGKTLAVKAAMAVFK